MGCDVRQKTIKWAQAFRVYAATSLSLLLPISFFTLARLTSARYFSSLDSDPPKSLLFTLIFDTNPKLLHALVLVVGFDALIHALITRISLQNDLENQIFHPSICRVLFFFGTFQISLGVGILGSLIVGTDGEGFGSEKDMLNNMLFFVGLHEIMIFWCSAVVRPVVDASIFGGTQEVKGWSERCALSCSLGCLWWWKLRHEIDSLVMVVEVKKDLMEVELGDVLGWWLYHMTILVGCVRIVKGVTWAGIKSYRAVIERNDVHLNEDQEDNV